MPAAGRRQVADEDGCLRQIVLIACQWMAESRRRSGEREHVGHAFIWLISGSRPPRLRRHSRRCDKSRRPRLLRPRLFPFLCSGVPFRTRPHHAWRLITGMRRMPFAPYACAKAEGRRRRADSSCSSAFANPIFENSRGRTAASQTAKGLARHQRQAAEMSAPSCGSPPASACRRHYRACGFPERALRRRHGLCGRRVGRHASPRVRGEAGERLAATSRARPPTSVKAVTCCCSAPKAGPRKGPAKRRCGLRMRPGTGPNIAVAAGIAGRSATTDRWP